MQKGNTREQVVFIDRDGVINVDPIGDYVKSWQDFRFHEGVLDGLKRFTDTGYKIVLISNQAGVGDGVFSEKALWDINERMLEEFRKAGIRIHGVYYCLHGKTEGCGCRKPRTGLFHRAATTLRFDKTSSYFVGDKVTDIEAGKNFGLKTILVRTGYGKGHEKSCRGRLEPEAVVDHFSEAVDRILCG